jgi:hypothetical protein
VKGDEHNSRLCCQGHSGPPSRDEACLSLPRDTITLPTYSVPPLCVLSNHLRVVLLVGLKVMLPEGVELRVWLLLRYRERIKSLLLAAVVLKDREVVALHPEVALVPGRILYTLLRLVFKLLKTPT